MRETLRLKHIEGGANRFFYLSDSNLPIRRLSAFEAQKPRTVAYSKQPVGVIQIACERMFFIVGPPFQPIRREIAAT